MNTPVESSRPARLARRYGLAAVLAAATVLGTLAFAPDASAGGYVHGGYRGPAGGVAYYGGYRGPVGYYGGYRGYGYGYGYGYGAAVLGGAIIGAAIARPYYYPPPVAYYPPAAYYSPPVVYAPPAVYSPPVYIERPAVQAPPVPLAQAPAQPAPGSVEERLRMLNNICGQGLLTEAECRAKRDQILQSM